MPTNIVGIISAISSLLVILIFIYKSTKKIKCCNCCELDINMSEQDMNMIQSIIYKITPRKVKEVSSKPSNQNSKNNVSQDQCLENQNQNQKEDSTSHFP
jgi:hypothetical protein